MRNADDSGLIAGAHACRMETAILRKQIVAYAPEGKGGVGRQPKQVIPPSHFFALFSIIVVSLPVKFPWIFC